MAERHVIVVDGPDEALRAFVAGFLAGQGRRSSVRRLRQ